MTLTTPQKGPVSQEAADSKPAMDGEPELALVGFEDILDYTLEAQLVLGDDVCYARPLIVVKIFDFS